MKTESKNENSQFRDYENSASGLLDFPQLSGMAPY
jgi:hypothetical protein